MPKFKSFLESIKVSNSDEIRSLKSETIEKYGIREFNLMIQEKQIFDFQKYRFINFNSKQLLNFQFSQFNLFFKPKYVFEYYNNYYLVIKANEYKRLIKYITSTRKCERLIRHLIISLLCGLNEISKNKPSVQFLNYDIGNFYINLEKSEKNLYKIYVPKIDKNLYFKSKFNFKYIGNQKEQLIRTEDIKYETLPFYKFLFSLTQYFKLYTNQFDCFNKYLIVLTNNDKFLSFDNTNMQNYLIDKNYYQTYEEILQLDFIIKTIGSNYLKNIRKLNRQEGGEEVKENNIKFIADNIYNDINNMNHFNNMVDYGSEQTRKEKDIYILNRINEVIDDIINSYGINETGKEEYNFYNSRINDIITDFTDSKNRKKKKGAGYKLKEIGNITDGNGLTKIATEKINLSGVSDDDTRKATEKYKAYHQQLRYNSYDNSYDDTILQKYLSDDYDTRYLNHQLGDNTISSSTSYSSSEESEESPKEKKKKAKRIFKIQDIQPSNFNKIIKMNNEIDMILNKYEDEKYSNYYNYLNEVIDNDIKNNNTIGKTKDIYSADYLKFLNEQIDKELIKHDTIKKEDNNYSSKEYLDYLNKEIDKELLKHETLKYEKETDFNNYTAQYENYSMSEKSESYDIKDYEKVLEEDIKKKEKENKKKKVKENKKNGGIKKEEEIKADEDNDYYIKEYEKEIKNSDGINEQYNEQITEYNEDLGNQEYSEYNEYQDNQNLGIETEINNNIDNFMNSRLSHLRSDLQRSEGGDSTVNNNNSYNRNNWNSNNRNNNQNNFNRNNSYNNNYINNNQRQNWNNNQRFNNNNNFKKPFNSQNNNNNQYNNRNNQNFNNYKQGNTNNARNPENIQTTLEGVISDKKEPEYTIDYQSAYKERDNNVYDEQFKQYVEQYKKEHQQGIPQTDVKDEYYVVKKNALGLYGNTLTKINSGEYNYYYIIDILPEKFNMSRFNFGITTDRVELIEYLHDFLINKSNGRDIDANSLSSIFSMMKIINTFPEDYKGNEKSLKYKPKYNSLTPDYISFRTCYPLTIEKGQVRCAANSTMLNAKLYNLRNYEDFVKYNLGPGLITFDKKIDDKDIELIGKLAANDKLLDNRKNVLKSTKSINDNIKKSITFKELKFYHYVKDNFINKMVCPHFPCLIGNKIVDNDLIDTNFITFEEMARRFKTFEDKDEKNKKYTQLITTYTKIKDLKDEIKGNNEIIKIYNVIDDNTKKIHNLSDINKFIDLFLFSYYSYDEGNDKKELKEINQDINVNEVISKIIKVMKDYFNKKNSTDNEEDFPDVLKEPEAYSNKSLIILTENPGYSFDSWIKPEYVQVGNVRKMVDSGYKSLEQWKSIIFQILYTFQCLIKHNITIPKFDIDNLFIQHSDIDPMNAQYSIYNINGISYYVPYYGDTVIFDILHRDITKAEELKINEVKT